MDNSPDPEKGSSRHGQVILLQELLDISPRADILDTQLVILTVLAGLITLGGLFLNSVAVIIGAMVISPLLEPIYAGTIFLAEGNMKKFFQHLKVLAVLVGVLILVSALVTACLTVITTLPVTPEILTRLDWHTRISLRFWRSSLVSLQSLPTGGDLSPRWLGSEYQLLLSRRRS